MEKSITMEKGFLIFGNVRRNRAIVLEYFELLTMLGYAAKGHTSTGSVWGIRHTVTDCCFRILFYHGNHKIWILALSN